MPKYIIEDNIDFYKDLLEDDNNNQDEDNNCLITNMPLSDKFVTLSCGHKFNYVPLYNDIFNHKQKFNNMEASVSLLKIDEIRCPYCRNKQKGVLPYYEEFGLKKVNGVNVYTPYVAPQWVKCQYTTPNLLFNPEMPESDINCVNSQCSCQGTSMPTDDNYDDSKAYCYNHKRVMIRKYKNDIKLKEKAAKLEATQKAKQKAKDEHDNMKKQKILEEEEIHQDLAKITEYFNDYNMCCAEYRELTFRMGLKLRNSINNLKKGVSVGDESIKCLDGFPNCLDGFDEKLHILSSQLKETSDNILKIHASYVNDGTENVVIQVLDGVTTEVKAVFCKEIIKTGKNKGNLCLKDLCAGQQFCKIHSSKK